MGISASLPKLKLYLPPTSQSSWSKRPFHVSLSSSLWTDLLMVAMLFRLNEFTLAHLIGGFQGFWLPTTVFFAVYDVWETRVLFDSVFMYQDDLVHHVLGIFQWLLLALMATTITPSIAWGSFDALLFSGFKLSHQSIRVFNYIETYCFSRSKRARKAAGVRSLVYLAGWPFCLAALCMIAVGGYSLDSAASMWVVSFFVQRIVWAFLKWDPIPNPRFHFGRDARAIKTNVPFKTKRYADWTMLQLGAIVLGFMTVPTNSLESYGVLIFGFTYVAALNLLSYSMNPEDPGEHAIIKGGWREFVWLELFSVEGLALMGIAVGLRVHLFYPTLVVLPVNRHYTWVLCISATVSTLTMFAQEYSHGGQVARLNGGKVVWAKVFTASLYVVGAAAFIGSDTRVVAFGILGLALVSLAVLLLQVLNGAFRRQIIKTYRAKLMGHFRAAVIAMVMLSRARRHLAELNGFSNSIVDLEEKTVKINHTVSNLDDGNVANSSDVSTKDSFSDLQSISIDPKSSLTDLSAKSTAPIRSKHASISMGVQHKLSTKSVGAVMQSVTDSIRSPKQKRSSVDRARRLSVLVKQDIRVFKVVLNDRVYTPPHVYVEGNKATKFRVQWSDLFFDVLFVGVVFRLGDLLLAGIGAGYSEASVHYELALGGSNESLYYIPKDPARSDAIFIFGSVFIAVWAMWQNKLAYSSKVGTNDVVHKMVDMAQGLFVLLCAVNITTPNMMEAPHSGNAYAVAGSLLAFQLSMVCLWVELFFSEGRRDTRAKGTALRNIKRDAFTVLPLLCSFATISTGASLSITTFLWSLSWFLPFVMRVAVVRFVNDNNAVRDLHRYVIHRLGDGALIVLGEGVLQIIRAETSRQVFAYLTIALGLFLMTATRIAMWSMDCFTDPNKHAQLLSLDAGLAAYFIRSVSAPSLVGMGVAMKKMINVSSDMFNPKNQGYYWLLCGASTISLFTLVVTYELHRFSYHRMVRTKEFAIMVFISSFFCYWASIPAATWIIVALCLFTWLIAVIVHFFLDDYFLLKEQVKKKQAAESNVLTRANSNYTTKTGKTMRFIDLERQLCGCVSNCFSCVLNRERGATVRQGSEDHLPAIKHLAPVHLAGSSSAKDVKAVSFVNDPMLPAVGLLERQNSMIMTGSGKRELSSDNPQFFHGEANRSPDASIRVPIHLDKEEEIHTASIPPEINELDLQVSQVASPPNAEVVVETSQVENDHEVVVQIGDGAKVTNDET